MANSTNPTKPASGDVSGDRARGHSEGPPWRRALVYGLGLSGLAASRLLLSHGTEVVAVEDRSDFEIPNDLDSHEHFELLQGVVADEFEPRAVDLVVVSPGVPLDRELLVRAVDAGHALQAEVEVAYQLLRGLNEESVGRIAGITGSNGKSTTTQLVEELLGAQNARACGNIGVPFSSCVQDAAELQRPLLSESSAAEMAHAVELSSFQLEGIDQFRAPAAALLNISPDHLDRHGSAARYIEAKRQIFRNQQPGDVAVLNADDEVVLSTVTNQGVRRRLFSLLHSVEDGCYLEHDGVWLSEPGRDPVRLFGRADVAMVGDHNLANAMAAILLAVPLGLDLSTVTETLSSFPGLPHRTQFVAERNGVRWYDDSKGTNVGAAEKSLQGFADTSVHLIAGGRAKGGDFSALREAVARKVVRLYLVGEAAGQLRRDLSDLVEVEGSHTIKQAVISANAKAKHGEVVLLSPACASFDQYASFAERGLAFQQEVAGLGNGGEHG